MAISVAVLPANHMQADTATDHMMCKLCCQQLYSFAMVQIKTQPL